MDKSRLKQNIWRILLAVLCVCLLSVPVLMLFLWAFGYALLFRYPTAFLCAMSVLAAAALVAVYIQKPIFSKAETVFAVFLPTAALFCGLKAAKSDSGVFAWLFAGILLVCCAVLLIKILPRALWKFLAAGFEMLLCGFFLLDMFFTVVFLGITCNTVVRTVPSPQNTYVAEVIDSNQGALGGDTFVEVRKTASANVLFFTAQSRSVRVYEGEWGELETMETVWVDENTLLVNNETVYLDHFVLL